MTRFALTRRPDRIFQTRAVVCALALATLGAGGSQAPAGPPASGFAAPSNFRLVALNGVFWFTFAWNDNSSAEDGYLIQYRFGGASSPWRDLMAGVFPANVASATALCPLYGPHNDPPIDFRVVAFQWIRTAQGPAMTQKVSNVITIDPYHTVAPPVIRPVGPQVLAEPTNLRLVPTEPYTTTLVWEDNSTGEDGYVLQVRLRQLYPKPPNSWTIVTIMPPDVTAFGSTGCYPTGNCDENIEYRVVAYRNSKSTVVEKASNIVLVTQ